MSLDDSPWQSQKQKEISLSAGNLWKKIYQAKLLKQHYFKEHDISIGMHYASIHTAL